jgi:hypothetical protein
LIDSRITLDQGRQFDSKLFEDLCRLLGIKRLRMTAYYANCFDGHSNRYQGGPERSGRRNDLRHRNSTTGAILFICDPASELRIRQLGKRTHR